MLRRYMLLSAILFCTAVSAKVREINDAAAFRAARADDSKVYVVKFYASWCGPCKMYNPIFEKFVQGHQHDNVVYLTVNGGSDEADALMKQYEITGFPTTIIIERGQIVERVTGVQTEAKLEALLKKRKIVFGKGDGTHAHHKAKHAASDKSDICEG